MTTQAEPGLCATCVHRRTVRSGRGSTFILCQRSRFDAAFPRYPRLPVLRCRGYQAGDPPMPEEPPLESGG